MFKLAIEACYKSDFGLMHAIFLSLELRKSVYFFGTPGIQCKLFYIKINQTWPLVEKIKLLMRQQRFESLTHML